MKRYNCTLSDKRGAFGECMEVHGAGRYVLFSDVEKLQRRMQELLEKFHRTGVAIERAISTGSVLADHPLKSRLELLANHYKREQALADGMVAMADRCKLLTDLLLEVTMVVPAIGVAIDDLPVVDAFLERIEAALAGTSPKRPDNEWTDATQTSTEQDYRELQAQHDQVQSRMKAALDALREAKHCVYLAEKNAMNMNSRDKHAVLGARIDALLAGQVPAPDVTATETIRTAPEHIWLQVGDQSHYHSEPFPSDTSEVSWCPDSVTGCEVPYVRADLAGKAPEQHKTNWPDKCPITRRNFFMEIDGVPTYGGPYDSYTIPEMLGTPEQPWHDRELFVRRFDHDRGCWVDDEIISQRVIHDGVLDDLLGREELSIPEGWQLVPVEPAFAMLAADGCKEHHEGQECTFHKNRRRIWAAMLAAAPKHQGGEPCALESRSSSKD